MSLLDEYATKDNSETLEAGNADTGEFIMFSRFSGYMLFEGVVHDVKLKDEIREAVRNAERIAYKEAVNTIKRKIEAHLQGC